MDTTAAIAQIRKNHPQACEFAPVIATDGRRLGLTFRTRRSTDTARYKWVRPDGTVHHQAYDYRGAAEAFALAADRGSSRRGGHKALRSLLPTW